MVDERPAARRGWLMARPLAPQCRCAPTATMGPLIGILQSAARTSVEPGAPPPGTVEVDARPQPLAQPHGRTAPASSGVSIVRRYWIRTRVCSRWWLMSFVIIRRRSRESTR
jgi:hypothetical protein